MTQPNWSLERAEVERVATDLRGRGYDVLVEPPASELPEFVRAYRPDILARSGQESVVVEVTHLSSDPERQRIRAIARSMEQRPGWRFMLLVPEAGKGASDRDIVEPLDVAQVRDLLNEARALARAGHSRSGLLIAWAGLEAAMRIAARANLVWNERADAWRLMRELVTEGLVSRDDYTRLTDWFRLRSAFAHGMQPAHALPTVDLDHAIEAMATLAEDLLAEQAPNDGERPC